MKRIWHNPVFTAPEEISGPEEIEDLGYDVYTKESGWLCAVSGMLIVAEWRNEHSVYRSIVRDMGDFGSVVYDETWDTYEAAESAGEAWIDGSDDREGLQLDIETLEVNSSCGN